AMKLFNLDKPPIMILYSFKAIILAHVFYNSPLFIRIVSSAWERISGDIIEAAESLGASRRRVFMTAVLPQILPPVIAAFSLIFILCFMSFSIILVLGGGPRYTTLEVEIYRLVRISLDIKAACSLAVLQSIVTLSFLFIYSFYQKKTSMIFSDNFRKPEKRMSGSFFQTLVIAIFFLFLFVIIIMPLVMIVIESFKYKSTHAGDAVLSLRWYIKSFSELGMRPVKNSLILALFNTLITCAVSVAALSYLQRKKTVMKVLVETFFAMSLGVSSIILSLSYMKMISDFNIEIEPLILLSILHSVIFIPLVFKSISVFYDKIDSSIIESAESIGAGRRRIFFTIELPLVRSGIITGGVLAFALSMGEINSTLMIAPDKFTTIPVAIYRLIGSYNFNQACAMGSILIVTSVLSFFLIDKSGSIKL
ncbi:MAG: iron ABC transporter permease, partial [Spirochaetia bacterium]|nr:iron ABC transporter permease [Spirochaetia bacterium]